MNQELLRIVDSLARDKNINRDLVLDDLAAAIRSAIRKAYPEAEEIDVVMDHSTGDVKASVDGEPMTMRELGRIAAQTAKQVIIQRIRDAERGSIADEYLEMQGQIVTGRAVRWESGSLVVDLGRTESYLPKAEQIPGESHRIEERIRAMVLDVKETPSQVKVLLTRSHPDFIRALFELEVPEVGEGIIEVKALSREAGYRTKVAVNSIDTKVDAVGACVGVRGSRIKNIVEELGGEKIDIVRWNDSSKVLIANSLKPAETTEIALCFELGRATVVVTEDQLSLAIGKRGQNVRLAARLTGWDIDILTPNEFNQGLDLLEKAMRKIEGVDSAIIDQIVAMGMVSVLDVEEVGTGPLIEELKLEPELAQKLVISCAEEAKLAAATNKDKKSQQKASGKSAPAETPVEQTEPQEEAQQPQQEAEQPETPAAEPVETETDSEPKQDEQ